VNSKAVGFELQINWGHNRARGGEQSFPMCLREGPTGGWYQRQATKMVALF